VLKSNAYGHGLILVAQVLEKETEKEKTRPSHIPFFVIDSYFEARALRHQDIHTALLIIGYTSTQTMVANRLKNIRFMVGSLETLRALALALTLPSMAPGTRRFGRKLPVIIHLKIDTGMRRQGILTEEIDEALAIIGKINSAKKNKKNKTKIILEGIATHFADADNADRTFTNTQIAEWNAAVKKVKAQFPSLAYWHASNTAGHGYTNMDKNTTTNDNANTILANVSRLGIGLYGIGEGQGERLEKNLHHQLKPALEMTTIVSGIKHIKKGETVGYSRTFTAPHDMTIATIPVGYFEGLDRRLSNKGFIKIIKKETCHNFFAPIIGRVSMNITTIDVTEIVRHIPELGEGYPVTIISAPTQSERMTDKNSVAAMARLCDTIPYEILVHIPAHLKRILI
jgi:alanine racemase